MKLFYDIIFDNKTTSQIRPLLDSLKGGLNIGISLYFIFVNLLLFSNQYVVTDYSMRNAIHVETLDTPEKVNKYLPLGVPGGCKNLFLLVMLENYDKKMVECVFACNSP